MDVNVTGSFFVARAVKNYRHLPYITHILLFPPQKSHTQIDPYSRDIITRNSSGSIIFTASMSGYNVNKPQPQSAYAVSKSGVHHLTRSLAGEWVGHNINVNSISPGIMNTQLSGGDALIEQRNLWMQHSPMGMGDPEDLAGPVVLLCSPAGKIVTGTEIIIDGEIISFAG